MASFSFVRFAVLSFVVAGGVLSTGCSGDASSAEAVLGDGEDAVTRTSAAVTLTEIDNGKSFDVVEGQALVVKLAANATTGFQWQVATTSRSLGYPAVTYAPSSGAVGAGGTTTLSWKTSGPLSLVGKHAVSLEYRRPGTTGAAAKTFSFTVNIVKAPAAKVHACAADAKARASKLLALHTDGDARASVADKVTTLAPVKAGRGDASLDVLEVTGYVYKAEYRMRFLYAQIPGTCALLGQEILELASP